MRYLTPGNMASCPGRGTFWHPVWGFSILRNLWNAHSVFQRWYDNFPKSILILKHRLKLFRIAIFGFHTPKSIGQRLSGNGRANFSTSGSFQHIGQGIHAKRISALPDEDIENVICTWIRQQKPERRNLSTLAFGADNTLGHTTAVNVRTHA